MNAAIYCKISGHDKMDVFLKNGREHYYLFTQNYRNSSYQFFKSGISLEDALHNKNLGRDFAITKIAEKLPSAISYIEQEYGIEVLEKTVRKNRETAKYRKHKTLKIVKPLSDFRYTEEMLVA